MDPEKNTPRHDGYLAPEPDYSNYDFPLPSKTESAARDGAAAAVGNDLIPSVSNAVAGAGGDAYGQDRLYQQEPYNKEGGDGDHLGRADTAAEEETYPEGGLRAWSVVLGSWLALFSALGIMNSLAIFQTYVATHQLEGYTEGTIGWIFSVYTFLCFFGGIYIGPVFDQYGPRWLVLSGTVCLVLGVMLLSICTLYWHFMLAFGILCGLGSSLVFTPSIAAVGHWFKRRRGFATGMASTGGSIGGIVFPLMMQSLFPRIGWGWTIRAVGFICLLLCGASNFLIRSRLPPARNASPHPDPRIFRSAAFSLTTAGIFLMEFALFIPLTYISSYMLSEGFSESFAFSILPILNAGSVFGRALPGWWADKAGPFNSNMVATLLSIVACLAIWLPAGSTTAGIVVFAVLFGFASGNNISISPVCVGRLCKTQSYGRYYSTTYTVVSIACLIGIPIGGEIVTATGGRYWGLIVFTGLVYMLALAAMMAAKAVCVGKNIWGIF
ncbi:major facilitator superfamily transporter [Colletotrichum higginsianum IMI 349063]|uniref:Major facilitator superfamily transporter n=3 Tax=Colletotrichum higginsianum TaxID=80884 RepID=A0A1B7Y9M7_COLHI|nr:major facilitator superfamily transporter [Colletotrichum higginsianum IMI 349063]OBR08756.1 major facilitator superfamily transporter [Colletotrichum higginsianum IMI 349063]TIC95733.1 Riboflavin transporter MCH5 [Colletotrichum higginsianum]